MSKSPNKSKRNTKRYFTDFVNGMHTGSLPPQFGRGANITFILPNGDRVASNPAAYKKLGQKGQQKVVAGICAALNIPLAA